MPKVSPSMFALIVLCFFLPFVTLSCEGEKIAQLSGVNLVTGTTIQVDSGFSKESRKVDAVGAAGLALVAAIGGAGLYFWQHKLRSVAGAAAGLIGGIALLTMKSGMAAKLAADNVDVQTEAGYTLALLLFFGAALVNAYMAFLAPDAPFRLGIAAPPASGGGPSDMQAPSDQREP